MFYLWLSKFSFECNLFFLCVYIHFKSIIEKIVFNKISKKLYKIRSLFKSSTFYHIKSNTVITNRWNNVIIYITNIYLVPYNKYSLQITKLIKKTIEYFKQLSVSRWIHYNRVRLCIKYCGTLNIISRESHRVMRRCYKHQ